MIKGDIQVQNHHHKNSISHDVIRVKYIITNKLIEIATIDKSQVIKTEFYSVYYDMKYVKDGKVNEIYINIKTGEIYKTCD